MRLYHLNFFFILALSSLFLTQSGCGNRENEGSRIPLSEEQLININRELVIKEKERIESYIKRKNLDMQMSDAGIWCSVLQKGEGEMLVPGSAVRLEYSCSLLDGTLCYSSEQSGYLNVVIGRSEIASGLDEALRIMNIGTEALIILPSNMAYGLVGDGDRIPARAALFYRIKVLPG